MEGKEAHRSSASHPASGNIGSTTRTRPPPHMRRAPLLFMPSGNGGNNNSNIPRSSVIAVVSMSSPGKRRWREEVHSA